ncbi:MAG: uroporphyrinogen-III C-methyltransferase [Hydrogenophaga sp.]|uniref:uroporphyrinogen-III C-methyltransferase n=1 Tax=Hydrogenophaga sp. TaxID=1904254 RepID=UPI001E02EF85|nr:uroporphyrinogen-III C-methyltransferase [Hydrogenophaga sp.]MBX3608555.1 uroporphyrinogen-III C-methyltransferase [Hydrogenophaga sp.]
MNDTTPDSTPGSAPATQAPAVASAPPMPSPIAPTPTRGGVSWVGWLGVLFGLGALAVSALIWQRLSFTQEELARQSREAQSQAVEARTLASQAEATAQELQARLGVAEVRLSEVSLQRSQLEELMLSLSRTRDDHLVQDLEATLRVALQHAQLTGSAQPLVAALQAADQRIARAAQPRLNPIQRAIARDIDRIRATALADIPALAQQIDELIRQVDTWPVANAVGHDAPVEPAQAMPATEAAPASPQAQDGPADWRQTLSQWRRWWSGAVDDTLLAARDLVRVSRIDQPDAALLAPEQAFFLRENLKLQLLNARLALLARQMPASQSDVAAAEARLKRYFDGKSPAVIGATASLERLRRDLVAQDLPRPDETLAALAAAAGGR